MTVSPESLQHKLAELRRSYAEQLPAKLSQINETWRNLSAATAVDEALLPDLYRQVHSLTGSGATFGFTALSNAARELEALLKSTQSGPAFALTPPLASQISEKLAALLAAAQQPDQVVASAPPAPINQASAQHHNILVYLVEDDAELAAQLSLQLTHFGYQVRTFAAPSAIPATLGDEVPDALIMDITFSEGDFAGTEAIPGIMQRSGKDIPVIFISSREDFSARLRAVRAGGAAYFTKPLEVGALIDALDRFTSEDTQSPARVLILDDDPNLGAFYAHTLRHAGMEPLVLTDPIYVLETLKEFSPELIMLDMYMPGCRGDEIATVIRQQPAYVSVPIVFLSAETDLATQEAAMRDGGDDFLVKPIEATHLVAAISTRVQRYRALRSVMVRDSLTGLLNHTAASEYLQSEVDRAQRLKQPLSFAMIDIDHFKAVNDTYGHPVGDRVIRSLARLLKQRLRKSDVVGRYGGEEFAVILPDTSADAALTLLEQIRMNFERIVQHAEGKNFSVTFSCGIATSGKLNTASELTNAADRALYTAKHAGRNRIVAA
jgi:diguanylate cyclase (GGDEF)-like protein